MDSFEIINLCVGILSLSLIAIGFYFTLYTLKKNQEWNIRKASADALQIVNDEAQIKKLNLLNDCFDYFLSNEPINIEIINTKVHENNSVLQALLLHLNIYELFAIGIIQGVYDKEYMEITIAPPMIKAYRRFQHFIENQRQYSSKYCDCMERLVLQWELKIKKTI